VSFVLSVNSVYTIEGAITVCAFKTAVPDWSDRHDVYLGSTLSTDMAADSQPGAAS
jgi:hypothetical protein